MMSEKLRWGILGTGHIAGVFAQGLTQSETGTLVAVGSRSQTQAHKFAQSYSRVRGHDSYASLLADRTVEAVYVATPHAHHAEWVVKAAEAGKHILCEKPMGINHAEAMAMVEAALRFDVFLMEAFMYRCHPLIQEVRQLIQAGDIGDLRLIHAAHGFHHEIEPNHRLFNNDLGGGAILDVGCYPVSMARLLAGIANGRPFEDPVDVRGTAYIGHTQVDEWAVATLTFPGSIAAQVSTSITFAQSQRVNIYGTKGWITLHDPWRCGSLEGKCLITLHRRGSDPQEITIDSHQPIAIEADTVAAHVVDRQAPTMSWPDTLGNMKTLDRWRNAIGLTFEAERPWNVKHTVRRRPLAVRDDCHMRYGAIEGLDKKVSRLVMGTDYECAMPHAAVMFDDFFERGGNTFDTAFIYQGGRTEQLLGHWMKNRGLRDEVVVIVKGAHTPHCDPVALTEQLNESLERLQTDYADVYFMHRDNLSIPVSEFVGVLNEHHRAGRIRTIGVSNWTIERFVQANEYAAKHGLLGFKAISNHFSLARLVGEPWSGVVGASDPSFRRWLEQTQIPLMPWSSQARGFFTDRVAPDIRDDEIVVRGWYSDDNFERRRRAIELGQTKWVEPVNIALAYVLHQSFPTFALIGPRLLAETRSCFSALQIALTPQEIQWLDLGT